MEPETKTLPYWAILEPHNLAIRFSFEYSHAMTFRVFAAAQASHPGEDDWTWELFDGTDAHELSEWESAFCEIDGELKWDGCINWQTNPECMMHGCGPSHARQMADLFAVIYHIGKRHFDLLGDAVPDLPEGTEIVAAPAQGMLLCENPERSGAVEAEGQQPGRP